MAGVICNQGVPSSNLGGGTTIFNIDQLLSAEFGLNKTKPLHLGQHLRQQFWISDGEEALPGREPTASAMCLIADVCLHRH